MAVSLVFQGENIEEVNRAALEYVNDVTLSGSSEPEKEATPAKKKAKAKAKTKVAEKAPEDPMDLFGDEGQDEDPVAGEEDDQFGATDPTIEDVKNALGAVVSAWDEKDNTGAEKAKKVLHAYGKADDLGTLDKALYGEVIEKSDFVAGKANG